MTTKLETIRAMVAAHEAGYKAIGSYIVTPKDVRFINEHAAMTLLGDLLPTLELMVAWESMESRDMPMPEQTKLYDKLNAAIAALVKDTE